MKKQLLKNYQIAVNYPEASGFEHLEMLQIRDQLALIENELNGLEKEELSLADQLLIKNAKQFYHELSSIIDLKQKREREQISSGFWWWYLDVLANLPLLFSSTEKNFEQKAIF